MSVWVPLEANPEVLTELSLKLGAPDTVSFCDIYGFDEELIALVPSPRYALILLFPITENYEMHFKEEEKSKANKVSDAWFSKQTIPNACGTMAILHAFLNNSDQIRLSGTFETILDKTKTMNATERAEYIETLNSIASAHKESAREGQSDAPSPADDVNLHFVSLVNVNGRLVEFDGRKEWPIEHGPCSDVLVDGIKVAQEFFRRDPTLLEFNMMALTDRIY